MKNLIITYVVIVGSIVPMLGYAYQPSVASDSIVIKGEWNSEMDIDKVIFRYRPSLLSLGETAVWAEVDRIEKSYTAVIRVDHPVTLRGVFYTKASERAITRDLFAILGLNMFQHVNTGEIICFNNIAQYYNQKENKISTLGELVVDGNWDEEKQWLALNMIADQLTRKDLPIKEISHVLGEISAPINKRSDYKALRSYVNELSFSQVGSTLFDFSKPDSTGNNISVSDYKGKILFIDFWASWCHFCREAIPRLKVIYEKYKDKGFEILGVSLDVNEKHWKKAMQHDLPTWKNVIETSGMSSNIATKLGIRTLPRTLLLNANGEIIAKDPTAQELEEILTRLLCEN